MITRRLFSYTLAVSAAAAGAQVALPVGSAPLLEATVVSTSTVLLDHMSCPHRVSAANRIDRRVLHQVDKPLLSVI